MIRELDFWHLASAYVSTMSSPVLVLVFRFGLSIVFSFGELLLSHYHKVFSSSQGTIIGRCRGASVFFCFDDRSLGSGCTSTVKKSRL